ncbi:MAG: DUF262 domain-containing protein [Pseudomonadota bacterium]
MIVTQSANMNIADYCAAMQRNEITVNKVYQRSDKVWPDAAKSYLIESILLGFPVPKFYLHLKTDPKSRSTVKEIVDGQQRSAAILDFYNDNFTLSRSLGTSEIQGLSYSTLSEDWQGRFLSYMLSIDQFVGVTSDQVRDVFRRMNSYTVPLNPEELRHAEHQGLFKWFIHSIGSEYTDSLTHIGVFTSKAVVRMQDLKLYTEIACGIDKGVTTTAKKDLDRIYRDNDKSFDKEEEFQRFYDYAFSRICAMEFLKGTDLAKPYQIYSIALALIHELQEAIETDPQAEPDFDMKVVEANFLDIASGLELSESDAGDPMLKDFISASKERTNVKDQREKRIATFREVLERARVAA